MPKKRGALGSVVGRSTDNTESMRDQIVDGDAGPEELRPSRGNAWGPGLNLDMGETEPVRPAEAASGTKTKKKRRNHQIDINYFRALDDILARSFKRQEAAHNIVEAFTHMMDARGIEAPFDDEKFERAASNMAIVGMMREMAWVFGLGPELSDRIAEHTVDRLFSPGHAKGPGVTKR